MRTAFSRLSKPGKSGSACKNLTKKSAWMQEKLQFLQPFMKNRSSVSNLEVYMSTFIKIKLLIFLKIYCLNYFTLS